MVQHVRLERPPSLTDAAVATLSSAILGGSFLPGQRLIETELSSSLGISRAPLREALRSLANEGLIEIRQNRGAFVLEPSPDEIEQMALLRALTEGAAARLVASRRDGASLSRLKRILGEQRSAARAKNGAAFLDAHWRFHHGICLESRNSYLVRSLNAASNLIRLYHQITGVNRERMLRNNGVFLGVLETSSPEDAEALLRSQILRVAYETLDRPIPAVLAGYVTRAIDPNGKILSIEGASAP